jgi:hypothetical protein
MDFLKDGEVKIENPLVAQTIAETTDKIRCDNRFVGQDNRQICSDNRFRSVGGQTRFCFSIC